MPWVLKWKLCQCLVRWSKAWQFHQLINHLGINLTWLCLALFRPFQWLISTVHSLSTPPLHWVEFIYEMRKGFLFLMVLVGLLHDRIALKGDKVQICHVCSFPVRSQPMFLKMSFVSKLFGKSHNVTFQVINYSLCARRAARTFNICKISLLETSSDERKLNVALHIKVELQTSGIFEISWFIWVSFPFIPVNTMFKVKR